MTARVIGNSMQWGKPPTPYPSPMVALNDSAGAAFDATALPASGAWRQSEMLNVEHMRRVTFRLSYNASASTTTGYPLIQVYACGYPLDPATGLEPLIGDDVWHAPMITDGSVTATTTTGTLPTGADWTNGPLFNLQSQRTLLLKPSAAVANSDKVRQKFSVDVTDDFFVYIIAAEVGDTTNRGTLKIWVNGS